MNSIQNQPVSSAPGDDSRSQDPAVPVWLFVVLFMLLYWGAVYFDEHGGWFDAQIYAPYKNADDLAYYKVGPGGPDGGKIYSRTCVACHQPSGQGQPGNFPPLVGSDWVNEKEPGRMIRLVLRGFQGPGLVVNGQPFNTAASMNAWGAPPPAGLTDEEIAAVITFVRQNKEWKNNASAVTPEQVKAIRGKIEAHPGAYSPEELMKVSPGD